MNEERVRIERTIIVDEVKQLNQHCQNLWKNGQLDDTTVAQANLEFLNEHLGQLSAINEKVWLAITDVQELRRDRAVQNTLALQVRVTVCRLQRFIEDSGKRSRPVDTSAEKMDTENRSQSQRKDYNNEWNARKLEPLKMDKFDGRLENWLSWWSRYEDRIHRDPQLNDRTRYDYLLQYLSKEVKDKLRNIPIDEVFYGQAITRLKLEYGNPEKLRTMYTQRLMNIKPITSRYDTAALRDLLQTVLTSVCALERVGLPRESIAPFFMPKLKESLPVDVYLEFKATTRLEKSEEQNMTSNATTVSSFYTANGLKRLLDFVEQCVADLEDIDEDQLKQIQNNTAKKTTPTAVALKTEVRQQKRSESRSEQQQQSSPQPCLFCKSTEHRTQACENESTSLQQRREFLIKENRCLKCSKKGHRAAECKGNPFCRKCNKKGHMTPLCNPGRAAGAREKSERTNVAAHSCQSGRSDKQYLIIVTASAIGPTGLKKNVRILFDSGSQSSFIRSEVAEQLGFKLKTIEKIPVSLTTLNQAAILTDTAIINIRLQSLEGGPAQRFKFFTLERICGEQVQPEVDRATQEELQRLNIRLSDSGNTHAPIDMLIGTDQLVSIQTHNAHQLGRDLEVIETAFGWALFGCRSRSSEFHVSSSHTSVTCLHCSIPQITPTKLSSDIEKRLQQFIEADALAIKDEPREDPKQFHEDFVKKIIFDKKAKRFIVELPFKPNLIPGKNISLATARLRQLERSLEKRGLRQRYQEEFQSLLNLNFIESVKGEQNVDKPVSYLPHREVIKEESLTTKLRIVFDASAKEKGALSLNETLHSGPNLTQDLLGVLLRFRNHRIVLLADVEKSFPQVIIQKKHRNALRFLWDPDGSGNPKTFRLTRNYFGFASSSFVLAASILILIEWHRSTYPEITKAIEKSYYVDDLATGAASKEEAETVYRQTKEIFAEGSFNLRKWISNSTRLTETFRQNGDGIEEFNLSPWCKVFGLKYNRIDDTFRLNAENIQLDFEIVTKRVVLSVAASVFDRVGFVAPIMLPAKLLIQKMWSLSLHWDDPVPEAIASEFRKWTSNLELIKNIIIPRRYSQIKTAELRILHVFCDASQYAYGFCAYTVTRAKNSTSSSMVLAKSRVAPLKNATIPRLELMALTLATEALEYIRS